MDKKDIKVEVKNDVLAIFGERKDEKKENGKQYSKIERHWGKFERSFMLPETVASDKIAAEFKNGLLTLKLPKTEKALPKEIMVDIK